MRQDHDPVVALALLQVGLEPAQLLLADAGGAIRHVVERDEVHALVIEGVMRRPEELLVGRPVIERGVVLAGHEAHIGIFQPARQVAEFRQPAAALAGIVGGVGQVAREHHEVRLRLEGVDRRDRLRQGAGGIRIDGGALESPVGVGELDEEELVLAGAVRAGAARQPRGEHDAAQAGELDEVSAVHAMQDRRERVFIPGEGAGVAYCS